MRSPAGGQIRYSLGSPLTPMVKLIIGVNLAVYLLISISSVDIGPIYSLLGLKPVLVTNTLALWQLFTYMFIHSTSFMHIFFNMLMVYFIGPDIERAWGSRLFLRYYLMSGVFAGLCVVLTSWNGQTVTVGASGAIMALFFAYVLSFPNRTFLFMFVFPMKAKYLFGLMAGMDFLYAVSGRQDNVSYIAHLGGVFFGVLWFLYYTQRLRLPNIKRIVRRKRMRGKLKLVRSEFDDDTEPAEDDTPTIH